MRPVIVRGLLAASAAASLTLGVVSIVVAVSPCDDEGKPQSMPAIEGPGQSASDGAARHVVASADGPQVANIPESVDPSATPSPFATPAHPTPGGDDHD